MRLVLRGHLVDPLYVSLTKGVQEESKKFTPKIKGVVTKDWRGKKGKEKEHVSIL